MKKIISEPLVVLILVAILINFTIVPAAQALGIGNQMYTDHSSDTAAAWLFGFFTFAAVVVAVVAMIFVRRR